MKIDVLEALKDSGLKFLDNIIVIAIITVVPFLSWHHLGDIVSWLTSDIAISQDDVFSGRGKSIDHAIQVTTQVTTWVTAVLYFISFITSVMLINMAVIIHQGEAPSLRESLPKFIRFVHLIIWSIIMWPIVLFLVVTHIAFTSDGGGFFGYLLYYLTILAGVLLAIISVFTPYLILMGKSFITGITGGFSTFWTRKAKVLEMLIVVLILSVVTFEIPYSELVVVPLSVIFIAGYSVALSTGGESGNPYFDGNEKIDQGILVALKAKVAPVIFSLKEKTVSKVSVEDPAQTSAERMAALKAKIVADKVEK